jgi:hypothetical protein
VTRALALLAGHQAAALLVAGVVCLVAGVGWLAGPAIGLALLGVLLLVAGIGQLRVREEPRP